MGVLALIPARGGSKGIERKNIKLLAGKPLIQWTIQEANKASFIDRLVVSTDDEETASIARESGADVPFLRPAELATDTATSFDVILHALEEIETYEWLILLQPTSPLRLSKDIQGIWDFCQRMGADAAVSVTHVTDNPSWMYTKDSKECLHPVDNNYLNFTRRQDLSDFFKPNGAIYLARVSWLLRNGGFISQKTLGYVMPLERSVDIDTPLDWRWAEFLIGGVNG